MLRGLFSLKGPTLLFLLLLHFSSTAQNGTLRGTVFSESNRETIPGANVFILGTTLGASSDLDGNFSINYIPAGTYTVVTSFISYKPDTLLSVKIEKGKTTALEINLKEMIFTLEGVDIVARKQTNTEISMISTIKQSNLIINGVSAMQISRSQDKDASEVIKRVPGVTIMDERFVYVRGLSERYNSVWLNNTASPSTEADQRAFSFDVIPSNMIDNILVYKTPAPELPSDFAGATIQIHTKNISEENQVGFSYQASMLEGTTFKEFYSYKGGKTDWLGFDDGTRQLPDIVPSTEEMYVLQDFRDGTPPEVLAERKSALTEIARQFTDISTASPGTAPIDNKLGLDMSFNIKSKKLRISNITSVNYKYSFASDQVARASYEDYDQLNDSSIFIYTYLDDYYKKSVQVGGIHNWSIAKKKSVFEFRNLLNQIGASKMTHRNGVDYYLGGNRIASYELGYMSRTIYSGQLSGTHRMAADKLSLNWVGGFSYGGKQEPDVRRIYTVAPRYINDTGAVAYLPYQLDYASTVNTESNGRLFTDIREYIYTLSAGIDYTLEIGNWHPAIRAGVYFENKSREFDLRTFGIARAVVQSQFNNEILYQSIDSVYADTNFNFTNGIKLEENTVPQYSYSASSRVIAGYLGLKIPFLSRFQLYGGVRIEKFDRQLGEFQSPQEVIDGVPDIILDTLDIYPSAVLTYNITNKMLIRGSYGTTVNRPEYREIAPYAFYDFEQSATVYGNPDLKDSYIQNLDFRWEFYPNPTDFLTIGGFYKKFDNPIEMNLFPASNGWDFKAVNSVKATNYGAELEFRKSFANLGGTSRFVNVIRNFSLSFNGSYIFGQVEKNDDYVRDKKRALFGQSPYVINTGIYYQDDIRGWSGSLLFNMFGKRIVIVGTPTIPNVYEMPEAFLDFTLSKRFGENFTVKFGAKNLLDTEIIYRQTFDVTIGNTDQIRTQDIRRYSPGRSYHLTFSYVL